ncbi:MAG: phosphatidate cytidylyltransferase [bacterium]|nr:phosphatidate cytidylyltransferase [bacterium]
MTKRVITSIIVGFTALFAMLAGGWWLAGVIFLIAWYASKEYTNILEHKGFLPSRKIILVAVVLFILLAVPNHIQIFPFAFTLSALMAFMWVLFRGKQPYIANVATTLLGVVYCGWLPLHLLSVRNEGVIYCMFILFGVFATDTFCYVFGCKYGKHKLAQVISPNKTIEGAIGGTVMCLVFTAVIGIFFTELPWYHILILGLLIAIFAQIGDLCESMIKRDAGVKDSSDLLPGHGGFLDRTDSYILTIPVVYYYVEYFINSNIILDLFRGLM